MTQVRRVRQGVGGDPTPGWRHRAAVCKASPVVRMALMLLMAMVAPSPAAAEMSGDDYRPPPASTDAAARARAAVALDAERRAAEAAAAVAAERKRQTLAQAETALRQRPLGVQLLDARCTACHTLAVSKDGRRGPLGWRVTVERMRWWHGAPLQPGEAALIARHLATTQPADAWQLAQEWGAAATALLLGPACWWVLRRRQHMRRSRLEAS